ncbi:hypothetical protein [Candidatus Nitrosocosmicus sp. SS]|jgi:hypothetical protein|nr:hypothetical protein [Candidatus Nitrosocosmicus sp. SS]
MKVSKTARGVGGGGGEAVIIIIVVVGVSLRSEAGAFIDEFK